MIKLLGTFCLGTIVYILSSYTYVKDWEGSDSVIPVFTILSSIVFIIVFIATIVDCWNVYISQIEDIESIKEKEQDKEVYRKKREELTVVFKQYLAEQYPNYEKEIFSKLLPDNITAVATMFPDIKASETITDYCNKISKLTDNIYSQDLNINRKKKNIRVRLRDKTGWWFLLPKE